MHFNILLKIWTKNTKITLDLYCGFLETLLYDLNHRTELNLFKILWSLIFMYFFLI